MKTDVIIERFIKNTGLIEKVFGTNDILYKLHKEKNKMILFEVFRKKDVYDIFPRELDDEKAMKFTKVLMTYYDQDYASRVSDEDLSRKKFLGLF